MSSEKIEQRLYRKMRSRLRDAEFERRYSTVNLFRSGAEPDRPGAHLHSLPEADARERPCDSDMHEHGQARESHDDSPPCIRTEPHAPDDSSPSLEDTVSREISPRDDALYKVSASRPLLEIARPAPRFARGDNIYTELLDYFHSSRICGEKTTPVLEEDANCILMTTAGAARKSTVIFGESRTGKTLIADRFVRLFDSVFELAGCSDKALTENADKINNHDIFYSVEFQGLVDKNPHVREAFKCVSENRDYTYEKNGSTVRISGDITIVSTAATENRYTQKQDTEMLARFIQLHTRPNYKEKLEAICNYQDSLAAGEIEGISYSEPRFRRLKAHIMDTYYDTSTEFENPFALLYGELYLPKTKKSVHYRTLYAAILNSFTKLSRQNRVQSDDGRLITSIEDLYLLHELFHNTYCNGLIRLATQSKNALLGDRGLTDDQKEALGTEYEKELEVITGKMQQSVDWEQLWSSGYDRMRTRHPALLDSWADAQSKGGSVVVYDPLKACEVELCRKLPLKSCWTRTA